MYASMTGRWRAGHRETLGDMPPGHRNGPREDAGQKDQFTNLAESISNADGRLLSPALQRYRPSAKLIYHEALLA